jgi:hypothetical protein
MKLKHKSKNDSKWLFLEIPGKIFSRNFQDNVNWWRNPRPKDDKNSTPYLPLNFIGSLLGKFMAMNLLFNKRKKLRLWTALLGDLVRVNYK